MQLTTKFDLGQQVFGICIHRLESVALCRLCNDTNQITIQNEPFTCPKCKGGKPYIEKMIVSDWGRIGKVQVEQYEKPNQYDELSRISYMLTSTGIGSGTVWYEEKLFATREEAQAFCDRKNAEPSEE